MELEEWRVKKELSYENLGRHLGMTSNKVLRICKKTNCIKLHDAMVIQKETLGEVGLEDMMPDEC